MNQQFTQLRQAHSYYKSSEASFETEKAWIWQDDAACAFLPPTMFEVACKGDPIAEGLEPGEIDDLNSANLQAAKKVCSTCPVWHLCYLSADESDSEFGVRAGIDPTGPVGGSKIEEPEVLDRECIRGHNEWVMRSDGVKYFCRACKREKERERLGFSARRDPTKDKCKNGHFEWRSYKTSKGYVRHYCRPCRLARRKLQDPAKMSA